MIRVQGSAALAKRWGISREAVRKLVLRYGPGTTNQLKMPEPAVVVETYDGQHTMYAWDVKQLNKLDAWYETLRRRRHLDET